MNRLVTSTRIGARASALARTRVGAHLHRCNSSSTTPPPIGKGKILVGLGALAIGSTVFASLYSKEEPKSAVEPAKKAAFSDGQISVIYVLGGPGAGKGTQCANLVKDHGFIHLSAGDLLRAEQNRPGSKYGELIARYIKEGTIVPQEVTLALLEQSIKHEYAKGFKKFLVDGFPRKMDQAISFEEQIARSSFTLFFECPEQVMLKRLLERGKTSGRADDNIESIKKRFRTFVETSMPVVDYFEKQGKVVKVSCDKPVDEVYAQVKDALKDKGI
ncbi:UMP-CMP kinase [Suhomyces tanzawaensis NRRL Y-17324]|uniref:Uridylate kinase n=1 Tax=Suhomyces tanzawaensis NRRL Y-17324 TaxID=984487 RepID=A0A1E4SMZ5_9ASCO|nr:UMP-CMP kinase [Suhomyces tanzawaensis NRRL Y-17324]ODV80899.1 UMP-CMP kinase [Suhomyces tanzawaensis NRRL Y-17324]